METITEKKTKNVEITPLHLKYMGNTPEEDILKGVRNMTKEQLKAAMRAFPSLFFIENRAQRRVSSRWYDPPYPNKHIITFGNRTGKSEKLGQFLTGVTRGNKYLHPISKSPFFDELNDRRLDKTLTVWWVCNGELMKETAADYKIIKNHIPDAKFKKANNQGVYREIHIPIYDHNGKLYWLVVHVKTHEQDTNAYAGDFVDVIICDEPPPQKHWGELTARTVTLKGQPGGKIIIGGTPWKIGGFLLDIIEKAEEDGDITVVHDEGSIWENCAGDELPVDKAIKYGIPKDPDTGHFQTWGVLSREGIEKVIRDWEQSGDPDEVRAREDGKFTHVQGRIYKIMNRAVHEIIPYEIPVNYPIIMVCDPHDIRPDVAGWYMVTPREKLICVMEYPTHPYENYTSRPESIAQTCETWAKMEANLGIEKQIVHRYGDPNHMLDPDPYFKKTKRELYAMHGFGFNCNIPDRIPYRHDKVRGLLWYDRVKWEQFKDDEMNLQEYLPNLMFFNNCRNHLVFMTKYTTKVSKDPEKAVNETPTDKWKDYPDIVGYAAVMKQPFERLVNQMKKCNSEYEAIKAARKPHGSIPCSYKNRRVMTVC